MTRKNQEAIRLDNTIDRVLIVDDDETVLEMLTKVVMSSDLEPSTASSGEDALELLQKSEYAAMLLDINLHGINGFDVIRQIRDCGNRIPIIIVSGRKEDYDTLYGLGIGADDCAYTAYWDAANPVVCSDRDVLASVYRRGGKWLAVCGSWADGDRDVELSLKCGGISSAKNAETGAALSVSGGRVRFRLAKHDLALVELN